MGKSCYKHSEISCDRNRSFDRCLITPEDADARQVETSWGSQWWTLVTCPLAECNEHFDEPDAHIDTVIIAVDGACRGNGTSYAKVSYGIFFHRDNWSWNECQTLSDEFTTNQQAELAAAMWALRRAKSIKALNRENRRPGPTRRLSRVVIKADSAYLVNAMTDWIFKWKNNGYINCRGLPVTNAGLFKQIESEVQALAELDVEVQFWHVRREYNMEADQLANAALDGKTPSEVLNEE